MENRDDILKELKAITPALSKVEKKPLDEVPVNYFSSFPWAMMKKVREQELMAIAPTLSQQEKVNALEVPADYFSSFSQQMLKTVSSTEKEVASKPSWTKSLNVVVEKVADIFFRPKYAYAFAGTVSMVIVGVMMFIKVEQCNDWECKMASLTDSEINGYLESSSDEYSEEIFETTLDGSIGSADIYKDALKDISDEELNNAILD
ncbi:MAG: hypothetical protein V4615_12455 [Bacteroidota bacterium]